jgi:uncharacterized membrane protein
MEEVLKGLAACTALVMEVVAVVMVALGAVEAVLLTVNHVLHRRILAGWRKTLFLQFGVWLLLGLQFSLGADIVRSVIAPTWNDIGQLAAIAAIRTFLNYFLEKDLVEAEEVRSQNATLAVGE